MTEIRNQFIDQLSQKITADGSYTFFSQQFQECFHSTFGAKQEAELKFVLPSLTWVKEEIRITAKAPNETSNKIPSQIQIIDLCYGLGYNSAAALEYLADYAGNLSIIGLENNLEVPQTAYNEGLLDIWQPQTKQILAKLATDQFYQRDRPDSCLDLSLIIGDARQTINQIPVQSADAIFFDPFSPKRCPQLWTIEFLKLVCDRLKPNGYLVTYCCAAPFRSALKMIGLQIWATSPLGRKAPGTIASWQNIAIPARSQSFSQDEWELLTTRAGIPYRDPDLSSQAQEILQRRQLEQDNSSLRSTSSWLKQHCGENGTKNKGKEFDYPAAL